MTVEADSQRGDAYYNEFYRDGGWKYSFISEYRWHRRHFVKRFGLKKGMRLMEVGCGCGFHTNLFRRMGFEAVGLDRSETGIAQARDRFPGVEYHCCDLREAPFPQESFDVVYARGLSHYHYDLMSRNAITTTATLLRYLRPGGLFVMTIVTDLSGRREEGKIWHNTLEDYERHFSFFGRDWSAAWHKSKVICAVRKPPAETPSALSEAKCEAPAVAV